MFCLPGYVPMSQIMRTARRSLSEKGTDLNRLTDGFKGSDIDISASDLFEDMVLRICENDMFVCSPAGNLMQLDIMKILIESWLSSPTIFALEERAMNNSTEIPDHFYSSYGCADAQRRVEINRGSVKESILGPYDYCRIPLFHNRSCFALDIRPFDFISSLYDIADIEDEAEILRRFEGWSLCVRAEFAKSELVELLRHHARFGDIPNVAPGRPNNVRQETAAAYKSLFPRGHNGKSWLEVLRAVNGQSGHSASVATLKRAVRLVSDEQNPI